MMQTNSEILKEYMDEVINKKRLDLIPKYFSQRFIGHGSPYVGLGLMTDTSSGDKVIVKKVLPGSPAAGKLMEGDEILEVVDDGHCWGTFEELRNGGIWGQGVLGTTLTICVRRGDKEKDVQITRGLIQGFEFPYEYQEPGMGEFFTDWPDVKGRLLNVIESGDLVAFHAQYQGKNIRYGRSAVWSEFGFVRFQDGKITDWWNSEEEVSTLKQLGYTLLTPELVEV